MNKALLITLIATFYTFAEIFAERPDTNIKYDVGQEYHYNYDLNIMTNNWEYFPKPIVMNYTAKFFLLFKTPTEGVLKIVDVALKVDEQETIIQSQDLTENCLKFGYKNGQITEINSHADNEKTWALNFKKGLLSVFQNSINNFPEMIEEKGGREEDVHGLCTTCYMVGRKEDLVEIRRVKNLTRCEHQTKEKYVLLSTPLNLPKEYISEAFDQDLHKYKQNIVFPFSGSLQECRYFLKDGVYNKLVCNETHVVDAYDMVSNVEQVIMFTEKKQHSEELHNKNMNGELKTSNLIYEFDSVIAPINVEAQFDNSKRYFKELCEAYYSNGLLDSAVIFANLVQSSKSLNTSQLTQLYQQTKKYCKSSERYFHDLIQYIGSERSLVAMLDILENEENLDECTVNDWLGTIAIYEPISLNTLKKAEQLLIKKNDNYDIVLTVSAITNTYCKKNQNNCKNDVKSIVELFENKFMDNYERLENDVDEEEISANVILILKALANIGLDKYETIHPILEKIISDRNTNSLIRIAAMNIYRKKYCQNNFPTIKNIYKDVQERDDVRISAFLKTIECAGVNILPELYKILKTEPSTNQVTNFIWSYLNSTQVKEEPSYEIVLLDDEEVDNKEKEKEKEKESENDKKEAEPANIILKEFIYGNMTEKNETLIENVIKNVTFEEAAKIILEDVELENKYKPNYRKFSHFYKGAPSHYTNYSGYVIYSESSFLPKITSLNVTYQPFNKPMEFFELYANAEGLDDYFLSLLGTQDATKHIAALRNSLSRQQTRTNPKLSLGLKLFGNDIKYTIFNGEKSIGELLKEFNPFEELSKVALKGVHYEKSGILADMSFSVPTAGGFPLNLKLISSYYARLNTTPTDPNSEFKYKGNVRPGLALSIMASLELDGFYAQSGLFGRLSGNVSYDLNITVALNGTNYSQLNVTMPEDVMDLLKLRLEVNSLKYLTSNDRNKLRKGRFFDDEDVKGPRCAAWRENHPFDLCYPEETFKEFFARLKKGFVEIQVYTKKNNLTIPGYPLFSYERTKLGNEKYKLTVSLQNETVCSKNLTLRTKDGNLKAILESEGVEKLVLDGYYTDNYFMWDILIDGHPFHYWESSLRRQFTWEKTKMNFMFAFYGFSGFARQLTSTTTTTTTTMIKQQEM